jgi:hypothetical protein
LPNCEHARLEAPCLMARDSTAPVRGGNSTVAPVPTPRSPGLH